MLSTTIRAMQFHFLVKNICNYVLLHIANMPSVLLPALCVLLFIKICPHNLLGSLTVLKF